MSPGPAEQRLPDSYFAAVYEDGLDPWGFESRWYEERKRAVTLAALPDARYRRAFEPGCAIGVLTQELALRCDQVVAFDLHPEAVAEGLRRCRALPNVEIEVGAVPEHWPTGECDLVVLSEVAYYLDAAGLEELIRQIRRSLAAGGVVVGVHWLGETDYPLSGAMTHRLLADGLGLAHLVHHSDTEFVLDVWQRDRP